MVSERSSDLMLMIRKCIEKGRYRLKLHQKQREKQRNILRSEVLYVLKNGKENPKRGGFDVKFQRDKYAIRGRTVDRRELEVIISFNHEGLLEIITTYDLNSKNKG
jgi:hypothetical protein